jgi:hypothetical protein
MRMGLILALVCVAFSSRAAEEKIRGVLEKTAKPGACAQITDALSDVYYINKTDEAEKAVASFVGKTQKVVITGTVETKEGDASLFFNLKSAEAYTPKMPPAPPAPATAAPAAAPAPAPETKADAPKPAPEAKPAEGDAKK